MIGSERLYLCKTLEMLIAREYGDDDAETEICGELDDIWYKLDGEQMVKVNKAVKQITLLQNLDSTFHDIREATNNALKELSLSNDTHVERVFIVYGDDGDFYYKASLGADCLTLNQLRELTTTIKEKLGFWVHFN